jgi:hypothetical protein
MSALEVIRLFVVIAASVFGVFAVLQLLVQLLEWRHARRLAAALVDQACPHCGRLFDQVAIRRARLGHGFDAAASFARIVCPGCSREWAFVCDSLREERS